MTADASTAAARSATFVRAATALLPRAAASGDRLVTALYLILQTHVGVEVRGSGADSCLTCAECRPAADGQYPCRTAEQAFWALDAILR